MPWACEIRPFVSIRIIVTSRARHGTHSCLLVRRRALASKVTAVSSRPVRRRRHCLDHRRPMGPRVFELAASTRGAGLRVLVGGSLRRYLATRVAAPVSGGAAGRAPPHGAAD